MNYDEKVAALRELGIDFAAKNCSRRGECFRFHGETKAMPSDEALQAALAKRQQRMAIQAEVAKIRAERDVADEAEAKRRLGIA